MAPTLRLWCQTGRCDRVMELGRPFLRQLFHGARQIGTNMLEICPAVYGVVGQSRLGGAGNWALTVQKSQTVGLSHQ